MYNIKISPRLDEIIQKLEKKNRKQVEIILKKAGEIAENPHRYKNLRAPLNNLKRVHVDKHFGFCCKNNFTAFLGYNYCFLYHY
jgi:mRNA-degrading endonuclease RelE of RelBE toxin-antitoxin system